MYSLLRQLRVKIFEEAQRGHGRGGLIVKLSGPELAALTLLMVNAANEYFPSSSMFNIDAIRSYLVANTDGVVSLLCHLCDHLGIGISFRSCLRYGRALCTRSLSKRAVIASPSSRSPSINHSVYLIRTESYMICHDMLLHVHIESVDKQ